MQRHRPLLKFCLALFIATIGPVAALQAAEWHIKPGESIQAAIAKAAPGDTLRVARGHYPENLRIDKSLKLIGEGRPTVDGRGKGDTVRIVATDVDFEGFIVADSGADLGAQNAGVYIQPGAHRATRPHTAVRSARFGDGLPVQS